MPAATAARIQQKDDGEQAASIASIAGSQIKVCLKQSPKSHIPLMLEAQSTTAAATAASRLQTSDGEPAGSVAGTVGSLAVEVCGKRVGVRVLR